MAEHIFPAAHKYVLQEKCVQPSADPRKYRENMLGTRKEWSPRDFIWTVCDLGNVHVLIEIPGRPFFAGSQHIFTIFARAISRPAQIS
jgi:hypothetical protein